MTPANILLTVRQTPYLLSIGSDGFPSAIETTIHKALTPFSGQPSADSGYWCAEALLRVDARYVYMINADTNQVHGFKSANPAWSQFTITAVGLAAQLGNPVLAEELTPFLPSGWRRTRMGSREIMPYARAHDTVFSNFETFLGTYTTLNQPDLQRQLARIIPPFGLKVESEERAKWAAFGAQTLYQQGVLCYRHNHEFVPYSALTLPELRGLLSHL